MPIFTSVGSPGTVSSASGGKVYGYNNISNAAPIVVAQANPARVRITFHNPGANDIYIGPSVLQNVLGTAPTTPSNVTFTPTTTLIGGTFRVFANGGTLVVDGECQGAWQALAASGTTNNLTVIESNV